MKRFIFSVFALMSLQSAAQDMARYNRALSAFNAEEYDNAALTFYELAENTTDTELRGKSEYYLAQSFLRRGMPITARAYFSQILNTGAKHPFYLKAVEGLVTIQQQLADRYLTPTTLEKNYNDKWVTLPLETISRINFLIGEISQRRGKFEDAQAFLEAVVPESTVYAHAQYLLGIVLVDPRFPGGSQAQGAIAAFERVLALKDAKQEDLSHVQQLALLGLGRTFYGLGQYQQAVEAYEKIPRFSKFWDQALFENGFARFQNDDFGGSLGSLQALHAPQFEGAFQPESWILKSTAYYFGCLYEEAKDALAAFDELYLPMEEKLRALNTDDRDFEFYFRLVTSDAGNQVPKPVLNWVKNNERLVGVLETLRRIDEEKKILSTNSSWKGAKLGPDLTTNLDQDRAVLSRVAGQLVKSRLIEAQRNIKGFGDQAEIIRFETSKAAKELAEQGVDQKAVLASKKLFRPRMPAEDWNYWKFQGEFWIDEIGYYQYTMKKGCPARESE